MPFISSAQPSSPGRQSDTSHRQSRRHGIATAELALIVPILFFLMLGAFEFSRAIMVKELVQDAARKACRTGILPGKTNDAVTRDVADVLTDNNVDSKQATVTILVNDVPADVSTAKRGDKISVQVGIPVSQVYWTTTIFLSGSTVESEFVVMMRQL